MALNMLQHARLLSETILEFKDKRIEIGGSIKLFAEVSGTLQELVCQDSSKEMNPATQDLKARLETCVYHATELIDNYTQVIKNLEIRRDAILQEQQERKANQLK